ncbi:MAG: hypothetical protein KGL39_18905 [Patescibacteria group bacterium]|nr:hypothetical protein [Patescibacteria group bacterium]
MPKFRALFHVDCTGYSDVFEAPDLETAKRMADENSDDYNEVTEWNRDCYEVADVIKLLEVNEAE